MNNDIVVILLITNAILLLILVLGGGFGINFLRQISRDVSADLKENIKIADNLYQAIVMPRDPALPYQKRDKYNEQKEKK